MSRNASPPTVSVVLPVRNGAATVGEAMTSILDQTHRDIEVIVIDDGSSDETLDIVRAFDDSRLVIVTEPVHRGLVPCLNRGARLATADVIARMDADDVAYPDRLALQYDMLVADAAVGLVATAFFNLLGDDPRARFVGVPEDHAAAQFALAFGNCILHSSVMFRRAAFEAVGGYDEARFPAEDYDLWLRMIETTRFAAVTSPQMTRRESASNVSAVNRHAQQELAFELAADTIEQISGARPSARVLSGLGSTETQLVCSDVRDAFACVHGVFGAVRRRCRERGIPTKSLRHNLPRMLLRAGLRRPDGRWCRKEVATLMLRHPATGVRLVWFRLRKVLWGRDG